jgi:hypothetical protein
MFRAKPLAAAATRAPGIAAWMAAMRGVAWMAVPRARGYWRRRKLVMSGRSGWRGWRRRSKMPRLRKAADLSALAICQDTKVLSGRRELGSCLKGASG